MMVTLPHPCLSLAPLCHIQLLLLQPQCCQHQCTLLRTILLLLSPIACLRSVCPSGSKNLTNFLSVWLVSLLYFFNHSPYSSLLNVGPIPTPSLPKLSYNSPHYKLTPERAIPLIKWFEEHKEHPYPTRHEKIVLCQSTQLTFTQVQLCLTHQCPVR